MLPAFVFFFNDTATTEIYTLSLHDALPIYRPPSLTAGTETRLANAIRRICAETAERTRFSEAASFQRSPRSEEHTSELQSHLNLVCRLLLEKKNSITSNCRPLLLASHLWRL